MYKRPKNELPLSPEEKSVLLKQYFEHYRAQFKKNPDLLNQKLPRDAFDGVLNELGEMLLTKSKSLASIEGPIRAFLDDNPLPQEIAQRLPPEFRVFCLALNAIKQWVAAEQSATDRYLLGGVSRKLCRNAADRCLVTGDTLGVDVELHHPVRDGRPAIPLSKRGHDLIERQLSFEDDGPIGQAVSELRRKGNRSWVQLRLGCLDLIGKSEGRSSQRSAANNRAFAKKAAAAANVGYEEILAWLKGKEL